MQVKDAVSAEAMIVCRTQISDLKSKLGCLMELNSEHGLENKHLSLVNKFVECWMSMWNMSCVTDKIYLSWPGQLHQFTCFWKCIDWYLISAINLTIRFKIYLLANN